MKFDWDEEKSRTNQDKHGIDFEAAKNLWLDEDQIEIYAPHPIEDRTIIIAKFHNRYGLPYIPHAMILFASYL
jgi:uncharacterized DUF497 family protein